MSEQDNPDNPDRNNKETAQQTELAEAGIRSWRDRLDGCRYTLDLITRVGAAALEIPKHFLGLGRAALRGERRRLDTGLDEWFRSAPLRQRTTPRLPDTSATTVPKAMEDEPEPPEWVQEVLDYYQHPDNAEE